MAIPVHLQQFKAAGIYRVVFDKSTILGIDSEILRLVVGYSEVGPFNIPVYVKSASDFRNIYGDISKKLEKRGIFFHRMAIQALSSGPILCLNLKRFAGETVTGATISSEFNPTFDIIDTVKINVEDIYDTSRFWELSADKLINLKSADNVIMDQYINIASTNTKETSGTYFIRKASGTKVSQYNITVSDWYSDRTEEMPEYLIPFKNNKISDFFAEIYVFKGHFTADQVLASSTLKNYFELATKTDKDGRTFLVNEYGYECEADEKPGLRLLPVVTNAYGDPIDTLDALYLESTANPIAHYIGCLIPYFKNKKGQYMSLDILFNTDNEIHNMMMSFNIDALEEGLTTIDLSGKFSISVNDEDPKGLTLKKLFEGTATSNLLGNDDSRVICDVPEIYNNVVVKNEDGTVSAKNEFVPSARRITGSLYVFDYNCGIDTTIENSQFDKTKAFIQLRQVGSKTPKRDERTGELVKDNGKQVYDYKDVTIDGFETEEDFWKTMKKMNAGTYRITGYTEDNKPIIEGTAFENGVGTVWSQDYAFIDTVVDETGNTVVSFSEEGPQQIITSVSRIEPTSSVDKYTDLDTNMSVSVVDVITTMLSNVNENFNVYGTSVSFLNYNDDYDITDKEQSAAGKWSIISKEPYNKVFGSILNIGDCLLAADATTDRDEDTMIDMADGFYDNVYVQDIKKNADGCDVIVLTGAPYVYDAADGNKYLVVIENSLNQEVGMMMPKYLEGYTYINYKPESTDMASKLKWQKFILSTLTEYKGLRTGLLNKSDIDYRYIVDTFESYVDEGLKKVLSYLAKEKQSAFAILNFPSIKTFVRCPYSSYTDARGVFNVDYIVKGFNKKKPAGVKFTLPEDSDGASFCAFYTPLKFSDGYIDTIVPSAGLVSNLFMEKYKSRQPYYIIAGPNYGAIRATGLVGPDYNYSQDELQLIEPYGVNCMIYRPGFGTFINANQTAKQTPVSALSKVNVRELVIYIQDEIEKVLQAYQWEFNNPTTRNAIKTKADLICSRVAANGGIQAFLNVMDESNNTPEIIDNEMAVLSTHIEPGMGCGKMVQELTLYRTGQMSAMISD